jgi:hypothetical protein
MGEETKYAEFLYFFEVKRKNVLGRDNIEFENVELPEGVLQWTPSLIADGIVSGELDQNIIRIIQVNPTEGTCKDLTKDVKELTRTRFFEYVTENYELCEFRNKTWYYQYLWFYDSALEDEIETELKDLQVAHDDWQREVKYWSSPAPYL